MGDNPKRMLVLLPTEVQPGSTIRFEKITAENVRCDLCRHWAKPSDWGYPNPEKWRFGSTLEDAKHCEKISEKVGEAYSAHAVARGDMFTMPDFGCALFEAIEAKEEK